MSELLPLGVDIKPLVREEQIHSIIKTLYGLRPVKITELNAYDDRNFFISVEKSTDSNPLAVPVSTSGYVLKIINSIDSKNELFTEGQTQLLLYLKDKINAPVPIVNLGGQYYSYEKFVNSQGQSNSHIIRLLEFKQGKIFKNAVPTIQLYEDIGTWLGKLQFALKNFYHPVYQKHESIWHLKSATQVVAFVDFVPTNEEKQLVEEVLSSFTTKVMSKIDTFEIGLIHGDFNEQNVLVDHENKVCAVLDFGDTNRAPYLFDIAACMCYMMIEAKRNNMNIMDVAMATLNGYQIVRRLTNHEKQWLKICICTRLCQSLVLGLYSSSMQPGNDYIKDTQENGWHVLRELWHMPDKQVPWFL